MIPSSTAAESLLRFQHVVKKYGDTTVVKDLSIDIRDGEFLAILGPSGCGKTTSLRMIAGLERCDGGEIVYQGNIVDSPARKIFVPTEKRGMGMVFQSYAIWPHMNVFENVAYPLRVRRMDKKRIKEEVHKVLEVVGLGHLAERKATQLSGGQQQRVALARSLVFNPKILLLDEPFSNLDAKLREQMRIEVRLLQQKLGITVVFVTHDQLEALSLADRIIMMNKGDVEQVGSPQEIYENPQTPFARDFLGKTLLFPAEISEVYPNGDIEAVRGGSNSRRYRTANHFMKSPAVADKCCISARAEEIRVEPTGLPHTTSESTIFSQGTIKTLLFIGDQYETLIELQEGELLHLYLSKEFNWHQGQGVTLHFEREVSIWPV